MNNILKQQKRAIRVTLKLKKNNSVKEPLKNLRNTNSLWTMYF